MSQAAVSVVMPCFNAARHLVNSVRSVQAQTFTAWELLIVDDGSTDESRRMAAELAAGDARIRLLHQDNKGPGAARNAGLAAAQAPLLAFLDSDDTWCPEFLATMVAVLEGTAPDAIAYCGWQNKGLGAGRDAPYIPPDYETGDKSAALLRSCPWPIHGALVRRQAVLAIGGFDATLKSCMDYDLWLRMALGATLVRVPQVLAYYHHHGAGQITGDKVRLAMNHLLVQRRFLAAHPEVSRRLGTRRIRDLTLGILLQRAYEAYWRRDLPAARTLFRAVMREGYGGPRDWRYMLASCLPAPWHAGLIKLRDSYSSPPA